MTKTKAVIINKCPRCYGKGYHSINKIYKIVCSVCNGSGKTMTSRAHSRPQAKQT